MAATQQCKYKQAFARSKHACTAGYVHLFLVVDHIAKWKRTRLTRYHHCGFWLNKLESGITRSEEYSVFDENIDQ